ncbi:MAG: signal peptidase I [Eubacteriaceae bacterium]|nr:signal peptidase I [Eubacteriaceae bacterium]
MENSAAKNIGRYKEIREWIVTILVAIALGLALHFFVFERVSVLQTSMYPTLKDGEQLIMLKINYIIGKPKRGDIAIIRFDASQKYVKRVIAMPGETIQITGNKVYINGEALDEPYLQSGLEYFDEPLVVVPEGSYFVMGDNRPGSSDSRQLGCFEERDFLGKVVLRISPFTKFY